MPANSNQSATSRKSATKKPSQADFKRPYPEFPLSYHPPSGRLYKSIKGKRHYFGYADNWQNAVDDYLDNVVPLQNGRKRRTSQKNGMPLEWLRTHFLNSKTKSLEAGEITRRTYNEYKKASDLVIDHFGERRIVEDLRPDDFEEFRAELAKKRGPTTLKNEIGRIRVIFNFAFDNELIDKPVRYGQAFKKPSRKVMRIHRSKSGEKMLEAADVGAIMEVASPQLKAMILLACNSGIGNKDVALLELRHVDLEQGWIDYPRRKTGVKRRFPLWKETAEALVEVITSRKQSDTVFDIDGDTIKASELVFVTKYGGCWYKPDSTANPVSAEFRKLLKATGVYRKGIGFYTLRHVFETIGCETGDQIAVDAIMAHIREDMASIYRERLNDKRLEAVTDHVRTWLFGNC